LRVRTPVRAAWRLAAAVLLGAGLLLMSGCGSRDPNVVRFWAMGREGEVVTQLLPEFERTHPGIRVEVQQLPWSAAHEKLLTAFAGDSTPDLCQLGNTWVAEFAALHALEPLDDDVTASPGIDPRDYFSGIWETNRVDGKLYGLPWYVDTRLLFYRRDLLAQAGYAAPPRSWPQWVAMLEAIKRQDVASRHGILLPVNEFELLVAFALQQSDPLLRDGDRFGNFESPGFERALQFHADMFRKGYAPPPTEADVSNVWNEIGQGHFVFYISGPWNIGEFRRRLPQDLQATWATAPLPGPDGPGASIAGGSSLVLFRKSQHRPAAWQLILYLSQPDVQRRFHALTGDLPPRRSTWSEGSLADDPHAAAFREQLERARPVPRVPEWERIADQIRLVAERVAHGDLTVAQAARELDERADRILEKRRSMLSRVDP
jgi:multiple sugar transport system substrate-binding protein